MEQQPRDEGADHGGDALEDERAAQGEPRMLRPAAGAVEGGVLPSRGEASAPVIEGESFAMVVRRRGGKDAWGAHQGAEDVGEEVELRGGGREAPKEERNGAAPNRAEEHHPSVRVPVAQVAKDDLAAYGGGVEDGGDDDGCERRGQRGRESDVQRHGEVR